MNEWYYSQDNSMNRKYIVKNRILVINFKENHRILDNFDNFDVNSAKILSHLKIIKNYTFIRSSEKNMKILIFVSYKLKEVLFDQKNKTYL